MPALLKKPALVVVALDALQLWRVSLLAVTLAHERTHPALALIVLAPINHVLFNLMSSLHPDAGTSPPKDTQRRNWRQLTGIAPVAPLSKPWFVRFALVTIACAVASYAVVAWYGSLERLAQDLRFLARTPEWWVLVVALIALTFLFYGPLWAAFRRFAENAGLRDAGPWKALAIGVMVWIWVDALFAALLQQVALMHGQPPFTQDITSYFDALYFSTITLGTVGYGDIAPVSALARTIVGVEVVVGIGLLGFILGRAVAFAPPVHSDVERR